MRLWKIALSLCLIAQRLPAQVFEPYSHDRTHAPEGARFEIVQASYAARGGTYRLDTFTGEVSQLVQTADSSVVWDRMVRRPHTKPDTRVPGRPNYLLFVSGLSARFNLLINVNTGATWQVQETEKGEHVWNPIDG